MSRPEAVDTSGLAVMAGAGARRYADVLRLPLLDRDYPVASGLVALAADRIRRRAASEALTPLYLRRPDAVESGLREGGTPRASEHRRRVSAEERNERPMSARAKKRDR